MLSNVSVGTNQPQSPPVTSAIGIGEVKSLELDDVKTKLFEKLG